MTADSTGNSNASGLDPSDGALHDGFVRRLAQLKSDIVQQGMRVRTMVEEAVAAAFDRDEDLAAKVIADDDAVDRVDVLIERRAVQLLTEATSQSAHLGEGDVRLLLTIVKLNNELERIADLAVEMAVRLQLLERDHESMPDSFRVMAFSAVGILRDVINAFDSADVPLAKIALRSEDTLAAFKRTLLMDLERQVGAHTMPLNFALFLNGIAAQFVSITDHSSNIAEQVIYLNTGTIVRHDETGWVEVPLDPSDPA